MNTNEVTVKNPGALKYPSSGNRPLQIGPVLALTMELDEREKLSFLRLPQGRELTGL